MLSSRINLYSELKTATRIAFRATYFIFLLISPLLLAGAVLLAALFSGRQPSTVALDVGISVMRFLGPVVMVLLCQELLSKEFERRYFLNSLTYPRARHNLLLGRFIALIAQVIGLLLVMALLLAILVLLIGQGYAQSTPVALDHRYLITICFIGLDLLVLTALATLLAVVASTPSFVLIGTFGFMLAARSFAAIIELLIRDASLVSNAENYGSGVGLLRYVLPDLGALDVRMITLYGDMAFLPPDWPWLVLSNLAYVVGLLAFAIWALQGKQFS